MELIRPRAADHVEDQPASRRLRRTVSLKEVVLLIRVRIDVERRARARAVHVRHVHAVDVVATLGARAMHRDARLLERLRSANVDFADDDARNGARNGPDVHAIRQRLQHFVGQHRLTHCGSRIEQGGFTGYHDAFLELTNRQ